MKTVRLTLAQATVRYLNNQYIEIDGKEEKLFHGAFGIFGHGNVTCLAEALYDVRDEFPTYRGQNEQGMALAAIGYARAQNRKRMMVATSSIGPGSTNMVTAAGVAYTNSLPVLLISGDYFDNRLSSPVLQEVEQVQDPTISSSDCFKPVSKYWDRITHPAQIIQSLPAAIATMLNPATCGPAFLGLCQDTQGVAYDYPEVFFEKRVHSVPRPRPCKKEVEEAIAVLKSAKAPAMIVGAGVVFSEAQEELIKFAQQCQIPFGVTMAAKTCVPDDTSMYTGPVGITGSKSINEILGKADVVIAVGTRLQDFTTASWSVFSNGDVKFISINTCIFDAKKHLSYSVIGDAKEALSEFIAHTTDYKGSAELAKMSEDNKAAYFKFIDERVDNVQSPPSYANVIGTINRLAGPKDRVIAAAGGIPGELNTIWRTKGVNVMDNEFGFSCMGYEVSGGYGNAIANKEGENIVFSGDGSYLMLNNDIYSSVLTGDKMIVIVCDNAGFAVINRLQIGLGGDSFNNLLEHCKYEGELFTVDIAANAKSMGANAESITELSQLKDAYARAKASDKTYVIHIKVQAYDWSEYSDAWWDVQVPEVSQKPKIQEARKGFEDAANNQQRRGV